MSGWRDPSGDDKRGDAKLVFALGAAAGAVVVAWLMFARSGEEVVSSSGFHDEGGGAVSIPFSRERRGQTGLAFVSREFSAPPTAARPDSLPGSGAAGASVPAAAASGVQPALAALPSPGTSASPGTDASPSARELAAAGVPTDASGLQRLGAQRGLLSSAVEKLLDHPRILKAVLDNKLVVDALMGRETSKRNCSSAAALQSELSNSGPGSTVAELMPLVRNALSRPDTAAAFAGSELGSRLAGCPSVQGLAHDPSAVTSIVMSNPQALSLVSDPRVAQALTSLPQGASLLGGVQSSLSGAQR